MTKTVSIGKRPQQQPTPSRPSPEAIDKWMQGQNNGEGDSAAVASPAVVESPPATPPPPPTMKRLTIDIPDVLHRRVKTGCSQSGLKMADVVRDLLENRFPEA